MLLFICFHTVMTLNPLLVTPFSMLVAASTNSGKTFLVRDLILNHYRMFDNPLEEVVYLYHKHGRDDELFNYLKDNLNVPIRFVEGFPAKDIIDGKLFLSDKKAAKCLILDDVVGAALRSPVFIDLFTVLSHHDNINVIAIMQNLHAETASQRQVMNNIIRNVSYIVLFPDRRQLSTVRQIARNYYNGEEYRLLQPFKHMIDENNKHEYMLLDFIGDVCPIRFNCLRPSDKKHYFL